MPTQLYSQPYAPNIRVVSGLGNIIFPDDYAINCDTSLGPVSIELPLIPAPNWSTQYKLTVNDITNNAGVNNITIIAPFGNTINGLPSVTINTNGACYFVTIGNNSNYLGLYGGIVVVPPVGGIVSLTNAQLLNLVNTNTIQAGQFYFVTDVSNVNFAAGEGVVVQGIKSNAESTVHGSGYFLNADYQGVGVYTGTPIAFLNFRGIWFQGVAPAGTGIGTVCIYNNQHYITPTGVWWNGVIGSNPSTDVVNWTLLPRTSTNVGYIRVVDSIKYNIISNQVVYRADKLGNEVDLYVVGPINSLTYFQWGRNAVTENKLMGDSYFNCRNSVCAFSGNVLSNSRLTDTTSSGTGSFTGNTLSNDSFITSTVNTGSVSNNNLFANGGLVIENSIGVPVFTYNEISQVTATLKDLTGTTSRKVAGSGLSTFEGSLDCNDPNVYDAGSKTLTINANGPYDTHIGIFTLLNIGDTIIFIRSMSTLFPTTFKTVAPNLPQFVITAVGVAAANAIVRNNIAGVNLVGRPNGTDTITLIKSGNLNQVTLANLMV